MISVLKPLVWLVALCCLIPRAMPLSEDSNNCEIATSSVSITCGVAAFFVALGSVSACIGTAGAACGSLMAIGAVAGLCGTGAGQVDCAKEDSDTDKIIKLLGQIEKDIADLHSDVKISSYTDRYDDDIEKIRNAAEEYESHVIAEMKNGKLKDSDLTKAWIDKMGSFYYLNNALIEIEDMIVGEEGGGMNVLPSIYKLARDHNRCSPDLYQYVLDILTEGTTLYFIYLKIHTKKDIPQRFMDTFKRRVLENDRMYDTYCRNNVAIESFRIQISGRSYADTSGALSIGVKQGETSCKTYSKMFNKPRKHQKMTEDDRNKFGSCKKTWFQPLFNKQPIQIRILSNSGNDAYIDKAAIKIGGVWREWVAGESTKINKHGAGNTWRTVLKPAHPLKNNHFSASQSSPVRHGSVPERAIDGNTNGNFGRNSCSGYNSGKGLNWWKLNLGADYKVFKVVIYNRSDCCRERINGVQVFILSGGTKNKCGKTIDFNKKDKQAYEFECEFVIADQVKIEQKGGFLTLCEVEVYGEKAKGKSS